MGRLDGKVAIVTGAASGIGAATAALFGREGARVVIADIDDAGGHATVARVQAAGGEAAFVHTDVASAAEVRAMVGFAADQFGALHVLHNNAGVHRPDDGSVTETTDEVWDRVIAVNLRGVFLGCRYAIPAMLAGGGGSIVNTASIVGLVGTADPQVAYTASKGGVVALTREVAVHYARRGIRANAICPGPVETPELLPLIGDPIWLRRRLARVPNGRIGRADEIAQAALFLASDESSLITGAALAVDGGITASYLPPDEPVPGLS